VRSLKGLIMYQKIRSVLFYLSIVVFFVSVPLSLIFSLGYDITWKNLKVSKAGLISVSSVPEGAEVYLNNHYTNQNTPAALRELKPGIYDLRLQLEDYYPWQNTIVVEAKKVTDLKEINLFKRIPYLEKVNMEEVVDFTLNKGHGDIFFLSRENNYLYKINIKDKSSQAVYGLPLTAEKIKKWLVSPDEKKVLYTLGNKVYVGFLPVADTNIVLRKDFMFTVAEEVLDIFWHADNEHIIVVTPKDIKVFELFSQGRNNVITLTALNSRRPKVCYDAENNALYFTDSQETSSGRYSNLYRIPLGRRQMIPFFEEPEKK
jgi:hypothetical protein